MAGVRETLGRVARAGSTPARRYVNRHVEALKDEVRQRAATERVASEFDLHNVRVAIDRLEEAIGFLGMQLTVVRSLLEEGTDGSMVVADGDSSADVARALTELGYERATGTVWTRNATHIGASDPPS